MDFRKLSLAFAPELVSHLAVSVLSHAPARLWIQFPACYNSSTGHLCTEDPVAETQQDLTGGELLFPQYLITTTLSPGIYDRPENSSLVLAYDVFFLCLISLQWVREGIFFLFILGVGEETSFSLLPKVLSSLGNACIASGPPPRCRTQHLTWSLCLYNV